MDAAEYDRQEQAYQDQIRGASDIDLLRIAGYLLKGNQSIRAVYYRDDGDGHPDDMGRGDFAQQTQRIQVVIEEIERRTKS